MIELKVQCDCGQKYKFDVEPVNGQMPFTVACPVCGADGTGQANALLQQFLPAEPAPALPPPPPVARPARFRIDAPAPAAAAKKDRGQPNFGLGLLGGLAGALGGALIYFLICKFTGMHIKILAVGVGALAGWGAEYLGRGEGSKELGGLTAVFTLAGLIGALYLVTLSWWHENIPSTAFNSAYTNSLIEARAVVKAVPTGSDEEIRNYLAQAAVKEDGEPGDKPNPAAITPEEIKEFRAKELPEYQDLASGKMTHEQYNILHRIDTVREESRDSEEGTFKALFLLMLLSKFNLVSLAAAAGLAYKMSTNA